MRVYDRRKERLRGGSGRLFRGRPIAILHGTEPWGQCRRSRTNYRTDKWESWFLSQGIGVDRISIRELGESGAPQPRLIVNPFGEDYPEEDSRQLTSLRRILDYVSEGGSFVSTGGWPFFYADSPQGRIGDGGRLQQFFHVDVDSGQLWEDYEPVQQPESSVRKYGHLLVKGGTDRVHIWRPVWAKYEAVERVLISRRRQVIVLGFLPIEDGGIVLTGMAMDGLTEFEKVAAFCKVILGATGGIGP